MEELIRKVQVLRFCVNSHLNPESCTEMSVVSLRSHVIIGGFISSHRYATIVKAQSDMKGSVREKRLKDGGEKSTER